MRPHALDRRVYHRSLGYVVAGHVDRARLAVASTVAKAIHVLEANGVLVRLRGNDEVRAIAQELDCHLDSARLVDRVLKLLCHCL